MAKPLILLGTSLDQILPITSHVNCYITSIADYKVIFSFIFHVIWETDITNYFLVSVIFEFINFFYPRLILEFVLFDFRLFPVAWVFIFDLNLILLDLLITFFWICYRLSERVDISLFLSVWVIWRLLLKKFSGWGLIIYLTYLFFL